MFAINKTRWVLTTGCLLIIWALVTPLAVAQPRAEIAASASYFRNGITNGTNLAGWTVNPDINFSKNLALAFDVTGNHADVGGLTASIYGVMAGPRFKYRTDHLTLFAHGLLGGEAYHISTYTQGAFALGFGGGIDVRATDRFSVRIFQLDSIHDVINGYWGHNVHATAGVVVKLGSLE
jgi:hypothetical protein